MKDGKGKEVEGGKAREQDEGEGEMHFANSLKCTLR